DKLAIKNFLAFADEFRHDVSHVVIHDFAPTTAGHLEKLYMTVHKNSFFLVRIQVGPPKPAAGA
ncbi:MAG: hypothetical protein LBK41_00860, partial [Clostridiales bacterium]|nr:hypothetical protein [Clostridiales bacterium]